MRRLLVLGLLIGCGGHGGASGTADAARDTGGGTVVDTSAIDHTIRVTLNDRPDHPDAFAFTVAFRDGDGVWQPAATPNGDTYSFEAFSPTWSVAWMCAAADSKTMGQRHWISSVVVAEFTVAERTSLTMDVPNRCSDRVPPVLTLTGSVSDAPTGSGGLYLNLDDQYTEAGADTYALRGRLGVHDLVVRKIDHGNESAVFTTLSTFIERDLSVVSSQHDVDLATAMPTRAFDVTVPANAAARATTLLYTKSGTTVALGRTTSPLQTYALDPAQVEPTDVYDQQVELDGVGETSVMTFASASPGPLAVQSPPRLGTAATAIVAETPSPMLHTTWPTYSDAMGYTWMATQPTMPPEDCWNRCPILTWTALVSPGVAGSAPGYRMPDLSGLAGWNDAYAFRPGIAIDGYAEADTSSAGTSDFPPVTPPAAGTQRTFVRSAFTVTP